MDIFFYNYFAKEYRESKRDKLFPDSVTMFRSINLEDVQNSRKILKNAFIGYHESGNVEVLKKLLGKYKEYVSCCNNVYAKERYNAFVYRYIVENYVSSRMIAVKLGVDKKTVSNYINKCIDEMLILCIGVPALMDSPKNKAAIVHMLVDGSRLFCDMAEDYVLDIFKGKREQAVVEQSRQLTRDIMEQFADAVKAYSSYCNDVHTCIDTNIRKIEILQKCMARISPAAIAEEYRCCESTVYADIRENEKRLAAMLFDIEEK